MSDSDAMWVAMMFGLAWYLLIRHSQRIADLEEDIDLLIDGDRDLAVAKRKLAGRQVARETRSEGRP